MQKNILKKGCWLSRILIFLLVLGVVLESLSRFCVELDRNRNPILNDSPTSLFSEPKNTIDVLTIGTSDVYSSVQPLEWWHQHGYTGYAWGEPSQRIFETYGYLKKIYRVQTPKVVFLEIGNLYRDTTNAQVLDSIVRANLGTIFPIVLYHRNFNPIKLLNLGAPRHSITKGYLIRADTSRSEDISNDYMKPVQKEAPVNSFCVEELRRCVKFCRSHGSQVILLSIPDQSSWNMMRHNTVAKLAEKNGVPYLDLNLELQGEIDWKLDTPDGGIHMNYRGARKVSRYLGCYLHTHYSLPNHRADHAYKSWNRDYKLLKKALSHPKKYQKSNIEKML